MAIANAFSAFRFEPDVATIDTLRTDLAFALREYIEHSGLGQAKVGEVLGLKQSVVSQIKRGDTKHLSVERLIKAMVRAKIPGYAEWGATAESARAAVGVRLSASISTKVEVLPTLGTHYRQNWLRNGARLSNRPWLRVKAAR